MFDAGSGQAGEAVSEPVDVLTPLAVAVLFGCPLEMIEIAVGAGTVRVRGDLRLPLARSMSVIDLDSATAQWGEGSSWWAYEPTANLVGYMRANTATVLSGEDGVAYRVLHPEPLPAADVSIAPSGSG